MVTTRAAKLKKALNMVSSNDDLLTEILVRLPAKSILRFKSVSKHWLSLLSDRHFTLLFDKLSISPGFFFLNSYIPFDVESTSTPHDPDGIDIVQSCNGLLLCSRTKGMERTRKYYVFNPTTKQFAVIPPLIGCEDIREDIRLMGLAFHHTDCAHYKLVCEYPSSRDRKLFCIQIYSSDTAKWRILSQSFPLSIYFPLCEYGVYWNGALYWTSPSHKPFYFKLDVEQIQNLLLPDYQDHLPHYFGESRGNLNLVHSAIHEGSLQLNVYEMLSDHSGWFLKYPLDLHELLEAYPQILYNLGYPPNQSNTRYNCKVLDVVRGEKEEDAFMVIKIQDKFIRYNILDKSFKQIFDVTGSFQRGEEIYRYIEMIGSF